jgi:phosphatidylglycerophosphatase A
MAPRSDRLKSGLANLRKALRSPAAMIATGFGLGYFPFGSGTIGSALALPLAELFRPLSLTQRVIALSILFSVFLWAADRFGRQFEDPDQPVIICDEIWGMIIVCLAIPPRLEWILLGFLLFRAFDIIKPWPISSVDQKIKNAFGVMLDDALAALYAILVILALHLAKLRYGI